MSFHPYPQYKDSGVEWLGKVPEHWHLAQLTFAVKNISNGITATQVDSTESTLPVSRIETISKGSIDFNRVGFIESNTPNLSNFFLNKGDILLSHINSLSMVGNCAVYHEEEQLIHGMNLLRLEPKKETNSDWLTYWLKQQGIRQEIESRAKPAINQASIPISELKQIPCLLLGLSEQTQIARFLDHETGKIDGLIAEQERLIELLKEKRQATISHAVTKGLNPDAPMKDSGGGVAG